MSIDLDDLVRSLAKTIEGDPWHGPALRTLVADVTPDEAVAHPIQGAHSIIAIVSHVTSWIEEVTSRAKGNSPKPPANGDWPELSDDDPALSWNAALARLDSAHLHCAEALASFPAHRLGELVGTTRHQSLGTGISYQEMFAGLGQHNAYHSGQIALLKRACRA